MACLKSQTGIIRSLWHNKNTTECVITALLKASISSRERRESACKTAQQRRKACVVWLTRRFKSAVDVLVNEFRLFKPTRGCSLTHVLRGHGADVGALQNLDLLPLRVRRHRGGAVHRRLAGCQRHLRAAPPPPRKRLGDQDTTGIAFGPVHAPPARQQRRKVTQLTMPPGPRLVRRARPTRRQNKCGKVGGSFAAAHSTAEGTQLEPMQRLSKLETSLTLTGDAAGAAGRRSQS